MLMPYSTILSMSVWLNQVDLPGVSGWVFGRRNGKRERTSASQIAHRQFRGKPEQARYLHDSQMSSL